MNLKLNYNSGVNEHDVPDDVIEKMEKRFEVKLRG